MKVRWYLLALGIAVVLVLGFTSRARAGLEFCFTPECSDGNPCTCDFKNPDGTCSHDPQTRWAAAARASGLQIEASGQTVVPPTPDSNKKNHDSLAILPLDPLAHVELFKVDEVEENLQNNTASHANAKVTAGKIRVLDQGGGNWLLTVDALQAVSDSFATDDSATSSTEGSTLTHVVLNGTNLGDVKEPQDYTIQDPLTHQRIDVRLLQKLPVGAAAGDPVPDPEFGVTFSGVTVNAIRVTLRDFTDPANPKTEADIIVGRADSRVDRFGADTCKVAEPRVSGSGLVFALDADETALDPTRQLARVRIGEVLLPSTGGEQNADLAHVGPVLDPNGHLVLESDAAFSHTQGTIDPSANAAHSSTVSAIEALKAFDSGSGPQLAADLVRAECEAQVGSAAPRSSAKTTLAALNLGGNDICAALRLEPACTPAPNTVIGQGIPGLSILLNEQIADSPSNGTGITVNAVHVHALGNGNPLNLPLGADVIVSQAHCDAKPAAGGASPSAAASSSAAPKSTATPQASKTPSAKLPSLTSGTTSIRNFLGLGIPVGSVNIP